MKKLFLFLVLSLFCTLLAQAKTVNLVDYGAIADDASPDDAAVAAAINDLKQAGGGTLIFPNGKVVLAGQHTLGTYGKYQNFRLQGDKNSVIEVAGPWLLFDFSNTLQGEVEGLTFVGRNVPDTHRNFIDVWVAVIYSPSTNQLSIRNTQFFGLRTNDSIVKAGNGDLVIDDVQFEGNSSRTANVHVFGQYQRGLTMRNTVFLDYANFQNQYYSKSHYGNASWVKVEGAATPVSATGQRQVRIEDCRFDEAVYTAVSIADVFAAHLSGLSFNVSGYTGASGITFKNVGLAEVKSSFFGWTTNSRPAIIALNNSMVEATNIKTGGGVYLGNLDATSQIEMRLCNGCQVRPVQ